MNNWYAEGKGFNIPGFNSRPSKLTDEMIRKYEEIGSGSLSDLIEQFRKDMIPYTQQDAAFNIIEKVASENPELIDSTVIESLMSYFPTSYIQKEISLVAYNNPEVYKENFEKFIDKANRGCISDPKDLVQLTKNLLGEEFFLDEEVLNKYSGKVKNPIIKAMSESFTKETFELYLNKYLEEARPDSVVHLVQATTIQNELQLADYLPELIKACDIRDRKALFEIALIGSNTSADQISKCVKHLRREDLTNVIYELLNKEVKLETVLQLGLHQDDLEERQRKLSTIIGSETKTKLLKALSLQEETIFKDNDDKELKVLDNKHYEVDYLKLHNLVESYINDTDKYHFDNEDKKLLEYNLKNITQILACDDKPLKHKQLQNILDHEDEIRNQIGRRRWEEETEVENDYGISKTSRNTSFSEAEELISSLEERLVSEFYESIGVKNRELSSNPVLLGKDIRYGVEIEEVGVTTNKFMDEKDFITPGFRTTEECSLRKYRKDYEKASSISYDSIGSEYVSEVLDASSVEDLQMIQTQIDVLKAERAKTNYSCGMHIHVSSPTTLQNETHIASRMTKEFMYIQDAVIDNFEVFPSRMSSHCKLISSSTADMYDRFKAVNVASLDKHGSVEFRFFNMPDALDMKVLESYIDFATCYYSYIEEENSFKTSCSDFVKENFDWLSSSPTKLKSEAIFAKLCEDIEIKDSTKKVLGRLPEIFDFYTAVEPGHPERYEARNVSIEDELSGITYKEPNKNKSNEDLETHELYSKPNYGIDVLFENALYEIASDEVYEEDDENQDESNELGPIIE